MPFLLLSHDIFRNIFAFLRGNDLLRLCITNSVLRSHGSDDANWEVLSRRELSLSRLSQVPSSASRNLLTRFTASHDAIQLEQIVNSAISEQPKSFQHMYLSWRQEFHEYSADEIKMAIVWWRRIETWLTNHAPNILATLNPPVDRAVLQNVDADMPRLLKLLYRFHNGQNLLIDDLEANRHHPKLSSSVMEGIFGGCEFYEYFTNMRLLPIESVNCFPATELNSISPSCFTFPFICLTLPQAQFDKFHSCSSCSNEIANDSHGYSTTFSDNIYTKFTANVNTHKKSRTAITRANRREISRLDITLDDKSSVSTNSGLWIWLYQYLARLEKGIYSMEPLSSDRRVYGRNNYRITLFPHGFTQLPQFTNYENGAITAIQNDWTIDKQLYINDLNVSKCVSNGIEVIASSIFVPEQSNSSTLLWTYSIRLRLLRDHPSRPYNLTRCKLLSRHWSIVKPPAGPSSRAPVTEEVSGEGVIGLFPELSIDTQLDWPFVYQSCMNSPMSLTPTIFSGYLEFEDLSPGASGTTPCFGGPVSLRSVTAAILNLSIKSFRYEVMIDPVMDRDGISYERKAIEAWVRIKGDSPFTHKKLLLHDLIPNNALRDAIEETARSTPDLAHRPIPITTPYEFRIFVENLQGLVVPYEARHVESVRSFKERISTKTGLPIAEIRLIRNGKLLVDNRKMLNYNFKNDDFAHIA